ncbi:hypothetical protein GCM10017783_01160 [Deinococcus piscis]|uniref:DivIVA domain-containing protein n=1 Tax=Deinococcus piscis TaxID=394230 RepID=A0ABQ3K349_9DEIO|nr:hypothetical protein [Deinococcus piscis]GHF93054.1 hypothetical protein GCM10017783_01160 [Deinococcus piscis]
MTTPERDFQQTRPEDQRDERAVPADAADAVNTTDRTAPSDAAGKPLYAEQDLRQTAGVGGDGPAAVPPRTLSQPAQADTAQADNEPGSRLGKVRTVTYSAETGGVQVVEEHRPAPSTEHARDDGGVLGSLKDTLLSRTEGLRQRGEQLANTARLKVEVMGYSRDLESLYARLGRAYHHRAAPEILDLIEQEIAQVERDIALRERQMESRDVSRELNVQRARAERERPAVHLPEPTVPSVSGAFGVEERPPQIQHHLETEKRDTFFGLDKGGVDQQATVAGGNAAFDTQIEPEDSVVSLGDLEKADNR